MKNNKWTNLARTTENRFFASCTVFEGKIFVTGGQHTNSVQAYDYYENKWTSLPDMIEKRTNHASVSMGNKLFVIGGYNTKSCEVFDSHSRKFTLLQSYKYFFHSFVQVISIGSNIMVFSKCYDKTNVYIYDVTNDHWCDLDEENMKNLSDYSCVKYCIN